MAKRISLTSEHSSTMSFPKALVTGVGFAATGLLVIMILPFTNDIYGAIKNWLLAEPQPPIP